MNTVKNPSSQLVATAVSSWRTAEMIRTKETATPIHKAFHMQESDEALDFFTLVI
jgi:hypothetical protein